MKKCSNCKHLTEYEEVKNRDHKIFICSGDGWEQAEDGAYELLEVSEFDAKDCFLFHAVHNEEVEVLNQKDVPMDTARILAELERKTTALKEIAALEYCKGIRGPFMDLGVPTKTETLSTLSQVRDWRRGMGGMKETKEELEARNKRVIANHLKGIESGGTPHDVWVTKELGLPHMKMAIWPVVEMANDDDGYYIQSFRSWRELNEFIFKLYSSGIEAWGQPLCLRVPSQFEEI
jgi:hypothetical protein